MTIADRIPAIAAADLRQARMLLGQEAEAAREAVSRAAGAETADDVDKALSLLADVATALETFRGKL